MTTPAYAFTAELAQPLPQALETLRAALAAEQMGIVSEVDMQATLKAKLGLDSPPQRLLGLCSPRIAHALVSAEPDIAALLPCGGSIAEPTPGRTRIVLQDPRVILQTSGSTQAEVRDALWHQLNGALPSEVKRLDGFLDISNATGLEWYGRHGFTEQPHYFIYEARRAASVPTMPEQVQQATASQHTSLLELAKLVFPSGYLTDSELTATNNDQHALFVIADGGRVDGYVYANIANADTDDAEVYVDYLVVRPESRGRKIGRTLLQAALSWGFAKRGVSKAALTVAADNANAQGLYASVGFALAATGVPMRLDRA